MPADDSATTQTLLVTADFITRAPADADAAALDAYLDGFTERLRRHLAPFLAAEASVEAYMGCAFYYLDDPATNAGRCSLCGAWTTDIDRADVVVGLKFGSRTGDRLVCHQCQSNVEA